LRKLVPLIVMALIGTGLPTSALSSNPCFSTDHTRNRRLMRGNLDGDRVNDSVWVGGHRTSGRCRYYLFVQSSVGGGSRVRLRAPDKFSRYSLRHNARPIALVRLDATPGREIAVKLLQGASVRPFGFFTLRQGQLRRMEIRRGIRKPLVPAEDMFAFGGGLAYMFATDCAYGKAPRTLIHSQAYPQNNARSRYVVERRWYQVRGYDLVRTTHPLRKEVVLAERIRKRFREFRHDGLLPHCKGKVLDPLRA
jgi:transposase